MKTIHLELSRDYLAQERFTKIINQYGMGVAKNPDDADIILFGGGCDINPKLYNHEKHPATHSYPSRDLEDIAVYNKYKGKPMVGICRGAQLGHVLSGGTLIQDVNNHYVDHLVQVEGVRKKFPSDHHQMMASPEVGDVLGIAWVSTLKQVMKNKMITNISKEQPYDIEIMYHPDTKFLCMQAHPEYPNYPECTSSFFKLLKLIFNVG
jgi:gamma-glutamyl-gamma-aminobutyrate hydrolase PuuD